LRRNWTIATAIDGKATNGHVWGFDDFLGDWRILPLV